MKALNLIFQNGLSISDNSTCLASYSMTQQKFAKMLVIEELSLHIHGLEMAGKFLLENDLLFYLQF